MVGRVAFCAHCGPHLPSDRPARSCLFPPSLFTRQSICRLVLGRAPLFSWRAVFFRARRFPPAGPQHLCPAPSTMYMDMMLAAGVMRAAVFFPVGPFQTLIFHLTIPPLYQDATAMSGRVLRGGTFFSSEPKFCLVYHTAASFFCGRAAFFHLAPDPAGARHRPLRLPLTQHDARRLLYHKH